MLLMASADLEFGGGSVVGKRFVFEFRSFVSFQNTPIHQFVEQRIGADLCVGGGSGTQAGRRHHQYRESLLFDFIFIIFDDFIVWFLTRLGLGSKFLKSSSMGIAAIGRPGAAHRARETARAESLPLEWPGAAIATG